MTQAITKNYLSNETVFTRTDFCSSYCTYITMFCNTQIGDYCFDDEVVNRFCYDAEQPKIELIFSGYFKKTTYYDRPCCVIIENWKRAKSKLLNEKQFSYFEKNLGIFCMLYLVEEDSSSLKVIVSTVDRRDIELYFETPVVKVIEL